MCDFNALQYEESEYMFVPNRTDFHTAKSMCGFFGSHLVFIETDQEQDYLTSALSGPDFASSGNFWIGIEKDSFGNPVWMDGSPVTFSNFGASNGSGDCYRICKSTNYDWRDLGCGDSGVIQTGFICERQIGTGNMIGALIYYKRTGG